MKKIFWGLIILCCSVTLFNCKNSVDDPTGTTEPEPHVHSWVLSSDTATVLDPGYKSFSCSCGETKTEISPRLFCETPVALDLTAPTSTTTEVYFGDFPQTVVKQSDDGTILYGKDKETVITISEASENSVTKGFNTYYIGSDGEYYCKVRENCRGDYYKYTDTTDVKKYDAESIRWFRVEPIKWKVFTNSYSLDYTNENAETACLLVAEECLTSGVPYLSCDNSTIYKERTIGEDKVSASNYKYSQIRAYLTGSVYYDYDNENAPANRNDPFPTKVNNTYKNNGFLQTAFTANAQGKICTTKVRNDVESSADEAFTVIAKTDGLKPDGSHYSNGNMDFSCPDTDDKIFLLSVYEVTKSGYGMPAYGTHGKGNARIRKATDYAMANNAQQSTSEGMGGEWWLRTPYYGDGANARFVFNDGSQSTKQVTTPYHGIVPALCISIQ